MVREEVNGNYKDNSHQLAFVTIKLFDNSAQNDISENSDPLFMI